MKISREYSIYLFWFQAPFLSTQRRLVCRFRVRGLIRV